jgi:hypothetical protein
VQTGESGKIQIVSLVSPTVSRQESHDECPSPASQPARAVRRDVRGVSAAAEQDAPQQHALGFATLATERHRGGLPSRTPEQTVFKTPYFQSLMGNTIPLN